MPPLIDPNNYYADPGQYNLDVPANQIAYNPWGKVNARMDNLIDRSVSTGDILNNEFQQVGPRFWDQYNRYGNLADQSYQGILTGNAGYTPEEAAQIQDYERLNGLQYSPDEYNNLFLTPEEQAGISGDPFGVFDYYNPDLLRGYATDYRDRGREALAEGGGRARGYIDNAQLGVDPGYAGRARGAVSSYANDANIDKAALSLSPDFLDRYNMSDAEVRDLANLGARTASSRWDAAYDDTQRRANAAGTMSPAALAVLRSRLDRNSNIDAADAATQATLQGKGMQRSLLGQGEQMRLGANQFITDAELARAAQKAGLALGVEEGIEDRRYRGESERANLGSGLEQNLLGQRLGFEGDYGNMSTGIEQYLQNTGQNLYRGAEGTRSDRNYALAENRQRATQQGQQNYRDYGFGVSDRTRQGAQQVADTRLGQEQAGRDYIERQGQFAGGMYQDAANRRADSAVGMTNAQLGGMQDRRQRRGPGFLERTMNTFIS